MKNSIKFLLFLFCVCHQGWTSFSEEGFFYQGNNARPVKHAGAILLKQYPRNAPDGLGEQLCMMMVFDKNLNHWTVPAGGVDAALDYVRQGAKKLFSPLMTIRREVLEETAGALYLREKYLESCPTLYSSKFHDLLAVTRDDSLSCAALSACTRSATENVDLSKCWRESKGANVVPVSELLRVGGIMQAHFRAGGDIKNLPSEIVSPNVSRFFKNPLVYLKTRLGQKVEFCAYYMGAIADALDGFKGLLAQNTQGLIFQENHDQIFQEQNKPEREMHFDPAAYLELHQDVRNEFTKGNAPLKDVLARTVHHYETMGKKEGRSYKMSLLQEPLKIDPSITSRPLVYLALNPDLQKHFENLPFTEALKKAEEHYRTCGLREDRNLYIAPSNTHEAGAQEIVVSSLPSNFDSEVYLTQNPEVAAYIQARQYDPVFFSKLHARTRGSSVTYHEFIADNYLLLNPDLAPSVRGLSDDKKVSFLRNHYLNHSAVERRLAFLPRGFNPVTYLMMNPDLERPLSKEGVSLEVVLSNAAHHYLKYGVTERRLFSKELPVRRGHALMAFAPDDFDALTYLALNHDLTKAYGQKSWDMCRKLATRHFMDFGKQEGRRY